MIRRLICVLALCFASISAQAFLHGSTPGGGGTTSLNFAGATAMPANTSFTRASSATYFDSTGNLQTATTDAPRFGYDFFSHQAMGLLVEGAATNYIRNNSAQGAVVGSPGTLPTNWSIAYNGITGLAQQVIGKGTQNNIDYVDIRIVGTASASGEVQIYFEATNNIASSNGVTWKTSSYNQLVGGSVSNLSYLQQDIAMRNSSNTFLAFITNGTNLTTTNIATNGWLRFADTLTTSNASVAFVAPVYRIGINAAAAVDITLRIGMPQLEVGGIATSVIRTTSAAVSRAADIPVFTGSLATLLGGSTYSVVVRAAFVNTNSAFIGAKTANYPGLGYISPNYTTSNGAGVSQLSTTGTTTTANILNIGLSVGGTARYLTVNGGTIRGGTTGSDAAVIGLGTTFGTDAAQGYPIQGYIASINFYTTALSQAALEAATNPIETTTWGDSLSAGTGSSSPSINWGYVGNLYSLTQQTINDQGVGGETSSQISARCVADIYHRGDITIFEGGRNNTGNTTSSIVADAQACINHLSPGNTQYVVLSVINAAQENSAASGTNLTNYNNINSINAAYATAFPGHYLDVRSAIVTASGGVNDAAPSTWFYNGSVHPNDMGYQVMATAIYNFGVAQGWPGYAACVQSAGFVAGPNLIQSPDALNGIDWSLSNATSAQNQGTAPDGTNHLNTLTDDATNSYHVAYQNGLNPSSAQAGVYTFSVYMKQGTLRWGHLNLHDTNSGNSFGAIFDLQAGTVGVTNTLGTPSNTSASIATTSVTGVYIATITMFTNSNGSNFYPSIDTSNSATPSYSSGSPSYVGSGQNIYAWNATLTTPTSVGNVCTPPASPWVTAGYNMNTFHTGSFSTANVDVGLTRAPGFQWYLTGSFGFADTNPANLTFNGDGSITIVNADLYSLAAKGTPVTNWHGTAFGGGAYFEATLSFLSNAVGLAWWADPMEHAAEGAINSEQWPGQVTGFEHFIETDFMENNVGQTDRAFEYPGTVIDWSGVWTGSTYPVVIQNNSNRKITVPVGTDKSQPHRYGFLWVPATASVLGYYQWYFDGLPTSDRITYSQYNCASPPSPPATTSSPWLYGALDCQHPELVFQAVPDTMRIYSVDVWQKSATSNIVK